MHPTDPRRLVILAEGQFGFHHGKTAVGVIRYGPDEIIAIIDSSVTEPNLSAFLPQFDIPIVATLDDALARPVRPDTLLIGIAPTGGRLPESWRATILAAIEAGLDVHSGLHSSSATIPEFASAAASPGTEIVDYRRPPERMETAVGRRHRPGKRVILTVGTDCAIGKMSVALELVAAARRAGVAAVFVPTGQTGMMIEGWGAAVDRLISDFAQGTVEWLVEEGERRGDWVLVEGQGSLDHPGLPLGHARADPRGDAPRDGPRPQGGPDRARLRPPARRLVPDRRTAAVHRAARAGRRARGAVRRSSRSRSTPR